MLSIPHMIVVFIIVLVIFGPQKLPELARGLGKLMAEFRKASTDFKSAFELEMREIERQAVMAERKRVAEEAAKAAAAQPVTQATSPGTEAQPPNQLMDVRATEAPVIAPVADTIPRSEVADTATEGSVPTSSSSESQSIPHDTRHSA